MTNTQPQLDMEVGPGAHSRWATLSPDGRHRYELGRRWALGQAVLWVMLNPSVADAQTDDQTTRRCMALTRAWGFSAAVLVNLYAMRSTDPLALLHADDPEGPDNPATVAGWLEAAVEPGPGVPSVAKVVVAWGASLPLSRRPHHTDVLGLAAAAGVPLWCLGRTQNGQPRHPGRGIPNDATLVPFWTPGQRP